METGASDYLPRVDDGSGVYRDVVRATYEWERIVADSDDSFATGTGRRFYVDTDSMPPRVLVLTDRLGVFQAFD